MININIQNHLNENGRINLGSFYTPYKYVCLVSQWLKKHNINSSFKIIDTSCGYGAFFELSDWFSDNEYIGNDIDKEAIKFIPLNFPFVKLFNKNALCNVTRDLYELNAEDKIVIVGNPPYNDTTSIINHNIKKGNILIDKDIKTRDLGLSFLLTYNKLKADYVAVLHPLSYLIKKANFNSAFSFFNNYEIKEHLIFSSSEFANTSKLTSFPIIVALYKRKQGNGLTYDKVFNMNFVTAEGTEFSLSRRDYIANYIKKYPHYERYDPQILFYTIRDINALKRSRTFIKERIANAVDVDPQKFVFYCYLDCFKKYAEVPYFMGNFDVPFIKDDFKNIMQDVIDISLFSHPEVFGERTPPSEVSVKKVQDYILRTIDYRR